MSNKPLLCQTDNTVFVIVDVQERLLAAMPNGVAERVIERTNVVLAAANALSIPIIATEQYPDGLGSTSTEITAHLTEGVQIIQKTAFSAMDVDVFREQLEALGRKQIVLVGMETHICILQTAIELQQQGYQVFVVEDAVCSRTKSNQDNALQRMSHAGVTISNVESVIFEWLCDSSRPEFKALAKLIV